MKINKYILVLTLSPPNKMAFRIIHLWKGCVFRPKNMKITCKTCRSWWDGSSRAGSSGCTHFGKSTIHVCRVERVKHRWHTYGGINRPSTRRNVVISVKQCRHVEARHDNMATWRDTVSQQSAIICRHSLTLCRMISTSRHADGHSWHHTQSIIVFYRGCIARRFGIRTEAIPADPTLEPTDRTWSTIQPIPQQNQECGGTHVGVWKRRFACLSVGMRLKICTTLTVIVATAVLHNIARLHGGEILDDIDAHDGSDGDDPEDNDGDHFDGAGARGHQKGVAVRNTIIHHFN